MVKTSILFVVTNHQALDASHPTGVWFEEFAIPAMLFQESGLSLTVASLRGGHAPVDPRSEPGIGDAPLQYARCFGKQNHCMKCVRLIMMPSFFQAVMEPCLTCLVMSRWGTC
jgi:hypothetical protein